MRFEFVPQKLVYGGQAFGHYRGLPVLAPRALPGERLEVEVIRTAKGVMHARPLRVLQPAPQRVVPPCPYFGGCGGCHYQHLAAPNQVLWKQEILRETLRRIGKISWDKEIRVHTGPAWNYRNQAELKVARQPDGKPSIGFFEAESHRLFPVDACLILSPRLNAILGELCRGEWLDRLAGCRGVGLIADDRDEKVMLTVKGRSSREEAAVLARDCLSGLPGVVSVAVECGGGYEVAGGGDFYYRVGEVRYRVGPGSFFQASRFLLPELVDAVVSEEGGSPVAGGLALDLFAGVGLFTLPLGRKFSEVIGVEAHPQSAADLGANVQIHSLSNLRSEAQTAFDFLRRFARPEPDLVVLDPPRAGLGAATLKLLVGLRPARIHYVSCSPPTLARDLSYLLAHGYTFNSIELFDFFPQTYHLECLARLKRESARAS